MADIRAESTSSPESKTPLAVFSPKAKGAVTQTNDAMLAAAALQPPPVEQPPRVQPSPPKPEPRLASDSSSDPTTPPSAMRHKVSSPSKEQPSPAGSKPEIPTPVKSEPTSNDPSPPPPPPSSSEPIAPQENTDAATSQQNMPQAQSQPQSQPQPQPQMKAEQQPHHPTPSLQPPPPPPPPQTKAQPPPPPPPPPSQPIGTAGPPPQRLPKTAKHRPKNARVFVGNLASEFTSPYEMVRIFHKYGELIEEPVLRRSFGFIQYGNAESASRAVSGEQGRIIGGIPIDLSIADNREVKKGTHVVNNTPFPHGPKGGTTLPSRKRRRSLSPRRGVVHPPQYRRMRPDPRNGVYLRILCMSATARNYARQAEAMFRNEVNLGCDIVQIVSASLGDALGQCMKYVIPYVLVVASKDAEDGTCTIRTLEKTGYEKAGRGNGIITLREAIDVCLIDRGIPRRGASTFGGPPVQMAQVGWTQPAGNMSGGQLPMRKPGWMSGPRAPPHPQQPAHLRGAPPPGGMAPHVVGGGGGPPYNPQHAQMAPHQMPMSGGGRPPYDMQDYQPGAPQMGWNQSQQPPMSNLPQSGYGPPQQDYGRYPPSQGGMMGRNAAPPPPPMQNIRDGEYDPTAVMASGGWNGPQEQGYNRGAQYPPGRPGGGSLSQGMSVSRPMMNGGNQGYGMGPSGQAGYRPDQSAPYGNQGYAQRPGGYNGPPPPPGGSNAYMGGYNNAQIYDSQQQSRPASWGPSAGGYEGGNQSQGYGGPGMQRRDGTYMSPSGGGQQGANSGGAPPVDIGKLTNLISAFQQQQQQQQGSARGGGGGTRDASAAGRSGAPTSSTPSGPAPLLTQPNLQADAAQRTFASSAPYGYDGMSQQAPPPPPPPRGGGWYDSAQNGAGYGAGRGGTSQGSRGGGGYGRQ